MLNYKDAMNVWAAGLLSNRFNAVYAEACGFGTITTDQIDMQTVRVVFDFDKGYACCGGVDPDCYCTFAEPPSASVVVMGSTIAMEPADRGLHLEVQIEPENFDFATVLGEILAAGGGAITND